MNLADGCVPHLKVPLPSSSLISRLTLKVKRSLSGVSGGACCADSSAFLAERRKAVAKLYNILLTCGRGSQEAREKESDFSGASAASAVKTPKNAL